MGLFSKLVGHTKGLNDMANAVSNVENLLDTYDSDPDYTYLAFAAWICKVGIQDIMQSQMMLPNYTFYATINGRLKKMTIQEAYLRSTGRLLMIANKLDESTKNSIIEIIEGGDAFYELDRQLPADQKKIFGK